MNVKFSYVFDRKKQVRTTNDKGTIELRCYLKTKKIYHSTGISISKYEWDNNLQRVVRHPLANSLNIQLHNLMQQVINAQNRAHLDGKPFDLDSVKRLLESNKVDTTSNTNKGFSLFHYIHYLFWQILGKCNKV